MAGPKDRSAGRRAQLLFALLLVPAMILAYLELAGRPVFQALENQTLDWRFRLRPAVLPGPETALLMIDDRTIAALGRWPMSRGRLADAVDRLAADGARVIALDLLLVESDAAAFRAEDRRLAAAIAAAGRVLVRFAFASVPAQSNTEGIPDSVAGAAYRVYRLPRGGRPALPLQPAGLLAPAPVIAAAASTAHASVLLEPDGSLRHEHPVVGYGEAFFPSLPVEAARLYLGLARDALAIRFGDGIALGDRFLATDRTMRLAVNFYGPGGTFETHSFIDLVEGRLPAGTFSGRIVLLGAAALGVGDVFVTPYSQQLPGAEYYATVVDNILHDRFLAASDWTAGLDAIAIALGGLAAAALAAFGPPVVAGLGVAALLALWGTLAQLVFQAANLPLNAVFPAAAIVLGFCCFAVLRVLREARLRGRAERQRGNLAYYVPGAMAETLAEGDRHFAADQAQPAAVMFVDMIGFTRLTEGMAPHAAAALLRDYHGRVERAVLAQGGIIDKFIGDGAMACFGLPEPGPADARDALLAARALVEDVGRWSRARVAEGRAPIAIGIGLHYGPVLAGTLGGEQQRQFTLTGDIVNVASRLEALTRGHGAAVIASDALVEAARAAGATAALDGFAALPPQDIRGRSRPLDIWAWPGPSG